MPHHSYQFSWSPKCGLCPSTASAQLHYDAVCELRAAITAGHSINLRRGHPIALKDGKAQLLCETAGSTGTPKVIVRSQRSWIASFDTNREMFGITPDDCVAVFGALVHSLALYGVVEAAHIGADICMLADLRPNTQCDQLIRNGVTILYLTPTQLRLLCATQTLMPNVRQIIVGGGIVHDSLRHETQKSFPNAALTQFYGASETSFITLANDTTPMGSVGAPYPHVTLELRTQDQIRSACAGEIWVKSPYLFAGYAQGDGRDTQIKDGFVTIGEFGRMDDDGNLFLLGRKSRMVTIADQNVFPEDIERYIADRFLPKDVVVMAEPDPLRGHRLIAIVQGSTETEDTMLQACRAHLGPLKSPRRVVFIEHLPLLPSGKPNLIALKHWLDTQE
ncbi:AMP-binding protein [Pacificibacter marinus]|nr:AMP-binding protein [Pacificibacter marinus]